MFADKIINALVGSPTTRALDALVRAYAKQGRFSGAVLVAQGEEILLRKGYGYAEQDGDWDRNTPATAFRIGSMSKMFNAIAVMQLVYAERIALDDPLAQYVADYPAGEHITLRHLLSNRSGIEDYITLPSYEALQTRRVTNGELIALFRDLPLRFAPGSDYGYSNSNWVLLAEILERVTGQPFEGVIRERILTPAGMQDSGLDWALAKRRAVGTIDTGAGIQPAPVLDSSTMHGGGDIHSTLDDLTRFAQALGSGQLLPHPTLDMLWESITTLDGAGYGLGFERHTLHNRLAIGHSGGIPGFASNFTHFPDGDVTIILLSNLGSAACEAITRDLAAIVFGAPYGLPGARTFVPVAADILGDYVGEYRMEYFGRTAVLRFEIQAGQLMMETQGLPKATLGALAENRFFGRSKGEVDLTFVREPDSTVNRIDIVWGGYRLVAERIENV
jgi:CubicO group peptidase (beta-lactamase class C family)